MGRTNVLAASLAISAAILVTVVASQISAQASPALTGIVSSQAEGPMEGVIVSATNEVLVSSGLKAKLTMMAPPTDAP